LKPVKPGGSPGAGFLYLPIQLLKGGNKGMSLFTAKGKAAKDSAKKKKVDLKKVYVKLKDGESIRVRLLGTEDYVEYLGSGDFNIGIYTTAVIGKNDPYTIACNSGIEKFEKLYPKKRYLFAFANIDTGELVVFDATKGQGEKLMDMIDDLAETIEEGSHAMTFKRVGEKTETSYSLMPIMKLKADDQEKFRSFDGVTVPEDFYESVLIPKTEEQKIENLKEAGFPVEDFFNNPSEKVEEREEEGEPEEIGTDETENF
jgi:hypothetical protein